MALSWFRLRWILLTTTIKATLSHFLSRKYPSDWSLSFHIQFAILKRLKEITQNWTMEEVTLIRISRVDIAGQGILGEIPPGT